MREHAQLCVIVGALDIRFDRCFRLLSAELGRCISNKCL